MGAIGYQILINGIGVVAIAIKILETQNKRRKNILFFALLNASFWVAYFVLSGDFTSALVNLIGVAQLSIFSQRASKEWASSKFWLFFFLAVQLVVSIFTWKDYFSLLPVFAGLISTITYFVMDEKAYRYFFLTMMLCWIGNGIARGYIIALIHDIFATVSILIAIIRYNILGKEKTNDKTEQQSLEQKDCE